MFFIILDSIFIGIKTELEPLESQYWTLFQFTALLDYFSCLLFLTETTLQLMDSFEEFWSDGWNVADLCLTVISLVPEVTDATGYTEVVLTANGISGQSFRIVRVLKVVLRVANFQIMVVTILEAFYSMSSILLVMLIVAYSYSIVGVYLFRDYTNSTEPGLAFQYSFMDIGQSMITLFQLLTLDQWESVNKELASIVDPVYSYLYIISWVCLGAFIFRNIFVGVMVNHFHKISQALREEVETSKKMRNFERMKRRLNRELDMQGQVEASIANLKSAATTTDATSDNKTKERRKSKSGAASNTAAMREAKKEGDSNVLNAVQKLLATSHGISKGWEETVQETLAALEDAHVETMWPRDSLFEYLQVMESLQENMKEYEELQAMASWTLLELHDT
ncbi:hypothetical protein HDU98_010134 [Podochytrium sp. JEL0797]|nr:hypothetical protein HDU98_010134 [Podochytrium sp. JEL0797]